MSCSPTAQLLAEPWGELSAREMHGAAATPAWRKASDPGLLSPLTTLLHPPISSTSGFAFPPVSFCQPSLHSQPAGRVAAG